MTCWLRYKTLWRKKKKKVEREGSFQQNETIKNGHGWGYIVQRNSLCPHWEAWSSSSSQHWETAWGGGLRNPPCAHTPSHGRWTFCSKRPKRKQSQLNGLTAVQAGDNLHTLCGRTVHCPFFMSMALLKVWFHTSFHRKIRYRR